MTKLTEAYVDIRTDDSRLPSDLQRARGSISSWLGNVSAMATGMLGANLFGSALSGIKSLVGGMVGGASEAENFASAFEVLLGSEEAAVARMAELKKFAADTPFDLPEIVQASRTLQTFTKGALATSEELGRMGDAAAITQQPITDVTFWVGRMYSAIQNGQPFGEAAMRLQEMGILTGGTRKQMEEMGKSGASARDVYQVFTKDLDRFSGGMEKASKLTSGLWSTLMDNFEEVLRNIGAGLLPAINAIQTETISLLDSLAPIATMIGEWLAPQLLAMAEYFTNAFSQAREGASQAISYLEPVWKVIKFIGQAVYAWGEFYQGISRIILGTVVSAIASVVAWVEENAVSFWNLWENASQALTAIGEALYGLYDSYIKPVFSAIASAGQTAWSFIGDAATAILDAMVYYTNDMGKTWELIVNGMALKWSELKDAFFNGLDIIKAHFIAEWKVITESFGDVVAAVGDGIMIMIDSVGTFAKAVYEAFQAILSGENPITAFSEEMKKGIQESLNYYDSGAGKRVADKYNKEFAAARDPSLAEPSQDTKALRARSAAITAEMDKIFEQRRQKSEAKLAEFMAPDVAQREVGADPKKPGAGKPPAIEDGPTGANGKDKFSFTGLAEYAKQIQASATAKPAEKAAEETAKNTRESIELQKETNRTLHELYVANNRKNGVRLGTGTGA